jgi:hypothetical protein
MGVTERLTRTLGALGSCHTVSTEENVASFSVRSRVYARQHDERKRQK